MALTRYKLGDLIAQRREKYNGEENLQAWGVSREGFISPKQEGVDTSIYNVFYRNDFVFNPARMELNSIALNVFFDKAICSSLYEIFYITRTDIVLPEYLNLFIKRDEFARKCWFEAIGSARNYFRVANLSEFEIDLPSMEIQKKYVEVYKAMLANQRSYERGLEDLKTACIASIEKLKSTDERKSILPYLTERQEINNEQKYSELIGVGNDGFIIPRGSRDPASFYKCNIFYPKDFVYNPSVIAQGAIAFNNKFSSPKICTEEYIVFYVADENLLCPEYLFLWLKRQETGRYLEFINMDSVRNRVYFRDLKNITIPIPKIEKQRSIANMFNAYYARREINEKLKSQLKTICPILIKGSLEEARQEEAHG